MKKQAIFVAATGQHVGKTTICLGLMSGLKERYKNVGFIKPIGQEHIEISTGIHVDKDVILFKDHFGLKTDPSIMSPILFPRGFTRNYLDGKVDEGKLGKKIKAAYQSIAKKSDAIVVEGTGHVGVGSIINFSNARVAKDLKLHLILVASGGLGSSFDALAVNKALCDAYKVKIVGVILNRVHNDKRGMILHYMNKALKTWNIPILGCIPFDPFLSNPSMQDYETLFQAPLLSGEKHHMRHFFHIRLVATPLKNYRKLIFPNQLIITSANREDIILATLAKHWEVKSVNPRDDLAVGMILTDTSPPRPTVIEALKRANIPMLYAPISSYKVMEMLTSYTVKIRKEDTEKINEAITLVASHIDFDTLLVAN